MDEQSTLGAAASAALRIGVVGTGRVAGSLGRALSEVPGTQMIGMRGRDAERSAEVAGRVAVPLAPLDTLVAADLLIVAVSDTAIPSVVRELSRHARTRRVHPLFSVHCSGATDVTALAPLADLGTAVGAWHPMQAFPTGDTAPAPGVTWTITTENARLREALTDLTVALGGRPRPLPAEHRVAYHAAATIAANHVAAMVVHATEVLTTCGFTQEDALTAALPLARSSLDALERAGLPGGLTGPAVRGDVDTIRAHLRALDDPRREVYAVAARTLLPAATARGVDQRQIRSLETHLSTAITRVRRGHVTQIASEEQTSAYTATDAVTYDRPNPADPPADDK